MASDLVIKVKHGNTLRRFNASTADLNMDVLKAKILDLFKFNSDADMTLTYIDEDSDVVTLVDDVDLCDAIGQRLNPLRLTVMLNTTNRSGRTLSSSESLPSGASTPAKSPEVRALPSFNVNTGFVEALKYVPEQFRSPLLKLTNDLVSKAASSAPPELEHLFEFGRNQLLPPSRVLDTTAEGLNTFSPVGHNDKDQNISPTRGPETAGVGINIFSPVELNDTEDQKALAISAKVSEVVQDDPLLQLASSKGKQNDAKTTKDLGTSSSASSVAAGSVDLNLKIPRAALSSANDLMDFNPPPSEAPEVLRPSILPVCPYPSAPQIDVFTNKQFPFLGTGFSSQNSGPNNRPIEGGEACDSQPPLGPAFPFDMFRRGYGIPDNVPRTFHRGVQCDGCGMHPIIGPRYKSKVKESYDLCSICFSEMGNEAEYVRIERSASYRSPRLFKEFYSHHPRVHGPPHLSFRGCGAKQSRAKLESRFIQDVTILDGTLMPPSTHFVKIWRMRNNGTLPWPRQTQLVWIGGDQFGDKNSVELEIPENGCAVDSEIDIAVDFTSPARPGRYISYWRMASPSGQKFGQRVWVLIQVDLSMCQQESPSESFHAVLNLNLPPQTRREKGKRVLEIIDVNARPVDGTLPEVIHMPPNAIKPVEPVATTSSKNLELVSVAPLIDVSNVEMGVVPETAATVEYPIIDFSGAPSEPISAEVAVLATEAVTTPAMEDSGTVEDTLLKELEEMGFKQIDLNKEVLRMNEYNLEQSVDDLCGVAEWDPILEELQEMGFRDEETNKKLLIKNGGSIKRVVLDLITGEKEKSA